MPSFVKSPVEVEDIQRRMKENRYYNVDRVAIRFQTEPAWIERVLPPGLVPTGESYCHAEILSVQSSNCVGGFRGGGVYVPANHEGQAGLYCLTMPMSSNTAIIWGRELFGEPKKLATVEFANSGQAIEATIRRYGTDILHIDAELRNTKPRRKRSSSVFHYKYLLDERGTGFQSDPTLIRVTFDTYIREMKTGSGEVHLRSSDHDPLGDIPVHDILGASFTTEDLVSHQQSLGEVDPDEFLRYALGNGRTDDYVKHDNIHA